MKTSKTEGIIFKKKDLLERDYLLTIFTQEMGKVRAIAKGVKKITSRRAPHLQTGNLVNFVLSSRNDMFYIQDTVLISGFSELKNNQQKIEVLYAFFFILDRMLPEQQREDEVYNLTKKFIIDLSRSSSFSRIQFGSYLQSLLQVLGYVHNPLPLPELISTVESIIHEKIRSDII